MELPTHKFQKTQLFDVLSKKEYAHRNEKDMEDLVYILMMLDFICNRGNECKFDPKELTELAKSTEMKCIEPGKRIFKQGDDANCMHFLI